MKQYHEFARHGRGGDEDTLILVDLSTSMEMKDFQRSSRLEAAQSAAGELLEVKRTSYPNDRVGLISFSSGADVVHSPATVREHAKSLTQAIQGLRTQGMTNISAALSAALKVLVELHGLSDSTGSESLEEGERGGFLRLLSDFFVSRTPETPVSETPHPEVNAKVILLTDGNHNTGRPKPEVVAGDLKRWATVYVIGIAGSPRARGFDEPRMRRIASVRPDGTSCYTFITDTLELVAEFKSLAHHIRTIED